MSNRSKSRRGRRAGIAVAAVLALGAVPAAAQASAIDLGTASPFVVLGGAAVTNTGSSVLNGDLGVNPGTELTGFGSPAVVNGVIHGPDEVSGKAQGDLTTAFGVAGTQPISEANDLTGTDLGGLTLVPGAYGFSSSAQLTGQLTLNAEGDPNAQFVFVIGSTLTTASASSVNLINGASPCNVYWRVDSSATLGSTTDFKGNLMALTDITINEDVHVEGRALAGNRITLIEDTLDNSKCTAETPETETEPTPVTPTPTPVTPVTTPAGGTATAGGGAPASPEKPVGAEAGRRKAPKPVQNGSSTVTHTPQASGGTAVVVNGKAIQKIVVSVDNRVVGTSTKSKMKWVLNGTPGSHKVTVRVTYKDQTHGKTTTFRIHVPSAAPLHPRFGPSQFTG